MQAKGGRQPSRRSYQKRTTYSTYSPCENNKTNHPRSFNRVIDLIDSTQSTDPAAVNKYPSARPSRRPMWSMSQPTGYAAMARPNIIIVGGNPAARSVPPNCAEIIGKSVNDKIIDALNRLCEINNVAVTRCCTERGIVDVDIGTFVKN